MSKNTMYVVVETIDHDYDDLKINYHSVCETACMAALNAKSAYERFISEQMLTDAPRFEELEVKSVKSEMRWTYVEKNEEKSNLGCSFLLIFITIFYYYIKIDYIIHIINFISIFWFC